MKTMGKIMFAMAILAFSGAALTACNTVEGFGQDVEATGDAIEDGSRDARN